MELVSDKTVNDIIEGRQVMKNNLQYSDFSAQQLRALKEEFDSRLYLNVAEAGIWLSVSIQTVYKMIKAGRISAKRITSDNGPWRIDVEKTRLILEEI